MIYSSNFIYMVFIYFLANSSFSYFPKVTTLI